MKDKDQWKKLRDAAIGGALLGAFLGGVGLVSAAGLDSKKDDGGLSAVYAQARKSGVRSPRAVKSAPAVWRSACGTEEARIKAFAEDGSLFAEQLASSDVDIRWEAVERLGGGDFRLRTAALRFISCLAAHDPGPDSRLDRREEQINLWSKLAKSVVAKNGDLEEVAADLLDVIKRDPDIAVQVVQKVAEKNESCQAREPAGELNQYCGVQGVHECNK